MTISIRMFVALAMAAFIVASSPTFSLAEEPIWTKGTVKKVDTSQAKVTIRHSEIKNLEMPPMTMIFRVSDPKMLEGLKPNQKLEFYVVDDKGRMVIKQIK